MVFGDRIPSAEDVRDELSRHLAELPAWDALRATFQAAAHRMDAEAERWKQATRVIRRTPGLRARYLEKHLAWTDSLVPEISSRLELAGPSAELKARTTVSVALGCFDVATERRPDGGTDRPLADLVDDVFEFVQIWPDPGRRTPVAELIGEKNPPQC